MRALPHLFKVGSISLNKTYFNYPSSCSNYYFNSLHMQYVQIANVQRSILGK